MENLNECLINGKAKLAVQLSAKIDWLVSPIDTEERITREAIDMVIAELAHRLQKDVGRLLLTMIAIKCGR